jgi:hypothetical protein
MADAGHIPSGSRHCVWTPREKGRLNRFPRADKKIRRIGKLILQGRPVRTGIDAAERMSAAALRRQWSSPTLGK